VNEAEQIKKQLARYEATPEKEVRQKSAPAEETGSIWDAQLPEDWTPPVRYQSEHEPGSDPATFKVGDIYIEVRPGGSYGPAHEKRQAIPYPRYPEPGAVITPEISEAYGREEMVWAEASRTLDNVLFLTQHRLAKNAYFLAANSDEWLARSWNWLLGLWAARGMTPPDKQTIELWARERKAA